MEKKRTLCIPRVSKETSLNEIFKKISSTKIGVIYKILELPVRNQEDYKKIIIVIGFKGERGKELEKLVEEGKSIKVIYKEPWYWKLFLYKKENKI